MSSFQAPDASSIDVAAPNSQEAPLETTQWEEEIAAMEKRDRDAPPPRKAIHFAGSSSMTNWQSLAQDFPDFPVVNRGFGGSQIEDSTRFAPRILLPHEPQMIVFYAGDNDLANGKTPQQVARDFDSFVATTRKTSPQTRIAYVSIKPSPSRRHLLEDARRANHLIEETTRVGENLDYIDIFTPMLDEKVLDEKGEPRAELFGPDDLHMTRDGYELWIEIITPHLSTTGKQ